MEMTAGSIRGRCRAEFKKGKKTSRLKYIRRLTGIHTGTPLGFSGSLCKEAPFFEYSQDDLKLHV